MKNIKTATVYLSSSSNGPASHKNTAIELGEKLAQKEIHLCFGGMSSGLMELVSESCLINGGTVTGVVPMTLKDSDRQKANLTKLIAVETMWQRKRHMFEAADVIFNLPGGYGTVDEAVETLYWAELGLHNKPIVFLNTDNYWQSFTKFLMNDVETMPHAKFDFKDFIIIADTVDEAFEKIEKWEEPKGIEPIKNAHLPHFEDEIMSSETEPYIITEPRIDDVYRLSAAIALKQLGAVNRPLGVLNPDGNFNNFYEWAKQAEEIRYTTPNSLEIFCMAPDMKSLQEALQQSAANPLEIDLEEKWGKVPKIAKNRRKNRPSHKIYCEENKD